MKRSLKNILDPTSRPESRRAWASLLVPLLVVALLVCHGAIGDAHQTVLEISPASSAGAVQAAAGATDAHPAERHSDHPADRSASHADYVVAALFAGLCAFLLGRLFGVRRAGRFAAADPVRRPSLAVPSLSVSPGRAPTAPEVQVFRL